MSYLPRPVLAKSTLTRKLYRGYYILGTGRKAKNASTGLHAHYCPDYADAYLPEDVLLRLPKTLKWYDASQVSTMKSMIDAVLSLDVEVMEHLKQSRPGFEFGFEDYLPWCVLRRRDGRPAVVSVGPSPTDVEARRKRVLTEVVQDHPAIRISIDVVWFTDGRDEEHGREDSWLMLRLFHSREVLTAAWVDPVTQQHRIITHRPGRYRALAAPASLYRRYLRDPNVV